MSSYSSSLGAPGSGAPAPPSTHGSEQGLDPDSADHLELIVETLNEHGGLGFGAHTYNHWVDVSDLSAEIKVSERSAWVARIDQGC